MTGAVAEVVQEMQSRLDGLAAEQAYLREFLGTYQRTTLAVGEAMDAGATTERIDGVLASRPGRCCCVSPSPASA